MSLRNKVARMDDHLDAVFSTPKGPERVPEVHRIPTPHDEHPSFVGEFLRTTTGYIARSPLIALALIGLVCGICGLYSSQRLSFKTKRADLISPSTNYHQRWLDFTEEFGDIADMVVVIEAPSPELIKAALDDLGSQLGREPENFSDVLYKVDLRELQNKGLQYLSPEQLEYLHNRLAEFGPILKGRWNLLNLNRIYQGLRFQFEQAEKMPNPAGESAAQVRLATSFTQSLNQFVGNRQKYASPWEDMFRFDPQQVETFPEVTYSLNKTGTLGLLLVKPTQEDEGFEGAKRSVERLREILKDAGEAHSGVSFALTGIPVLEYDEMRNSQFAMMLESIASYLGVGCLLVLGFRGLRFPILALVMLSVATCWSFGFTAATVGHLNILSVSFVAIVVGLGIDYAILFLSRYMEYRQSGLPLTEAIRETAGTVGPGIITAAATTSVAFFCAIFTDFLGVAELGLIAGGGIILCALAAFTFLPAILATVDRYFKPSPIPSPFNGRTIRELISTHPAIVMVAALVLVGLMGGYGLQVSYDYNLMNLQAEELESVKVQKRIAQESDHGLLFAVSLAKSSREAMELKRKFAALPTVRHVEEVASVMPKFDPDDTNLSIQGIEVLLGRLPAEPPQNIAEPDKLFATWEQFVSRLQEGRVPGADDLALSITKLQQQLSRIPKMQQVALLTEYQQRIAYDLLMRLRGLASVCDSQPVGVNDLPKSLVSRFVSQSGRWLLRVYPKHEIWDIEPLEQFIRDIRSVDPDATGIPLQNYEASRQIRGSYETVAIYALLASFLVLLIDFLSWRNSALSLIIPAIAIAAYAGGMWYRGQAIAPFPLMLTYLVMTLTLVACLDAPGFFNILLSLLPPIAGAVLTLGTLGILGVDLNPANLIILPLILGIGVDNGVHVMHDFRLQRLQDYRTSPSLINALFLTSMSNMAGFGSMILAAHRGLRSIGMVLTIGVGSCLFVSVVLLPAILTLWSRLSATPELNADPEVDLSHSPTVDLVNDDVFQQPYSSPELTIFYPSDTAA